MTHTQSSTTTSVPHGTFASTGLVWPSGAEQAAVNLAALHHLPAAKFCAVIKQLIQIFDAEEAALERRQLALAWLVGQQHSKRFPVIKAAWTRVSLNNILANMLEREASEPDVLATLEALEIVCAHEAAAMARCLPSITGWSEKPLPLVSVGNVQPQYIRFAKELNTLRLLERQFLDANPHLEVLLEQVNNGCQASRPGGISTEEWLNRFLCEQQPTSH
jgi:hypothetical protein